MCPRVTRLRLAGNWKEDEEMRSPLTKEIRFWPLRLQKANGNGGVGGSGQSLFHTRTVRAQGDLYPDPLRPEGVRQPPGLPAQGKAPTGLSRSLPGGRRFCPKGLTKRNDVIDPNPPRFSARLQIKSSF